MSIVSAPAFLLNISGGGVEGEGKDALTLSRTTLGNIGSPEESGLTPVTGASAAEAEATANATASNDTYVDLLHWRLEARRAAYLITAADLLYSLMFLLFVLYWARKTDVRARRSLRRLGRLGCQGHARTGRSMVLRPHPPRRARPGPRR